MNRGAFVGPILALCATGMARATAGNHPSTLRGLMLDMSSEAAKAKSLTVRHVGALVSMRIALSVENLARTKPIAHTNDAKTIAETFEAIRAAQPRLTPATSEQRWHLAFNDAHGREIAIVTSSINAPRHGTIAGRTVIFEADVLERFLAKHFAPNELAV